MLPDVKQTSYVLVLLLVALLLGCDTFTVSRTSSGGTSSGQSSRAVGQFDYYLLNLSWSPEFCHSHPDSR